MDGLSEALERIKRDTLGRIVGDPASVGEQLGDGDGLSALVLWEGGA
jgi:hypothetical protein